MRIGILHGWLLDGSGSNIYVRSLAKGLADRGNEVRIICQEPRPESFIDARDTLSVHVPELSRDIMPVYVGDTDYPGFERVVPFTELAGSERLERYIEEFMAGAEKVCLEHRLQILHANHVFPMPEVARRLKRKLGIAYIVYPHGSAIEYAVKRSPVLAQAAVPGLDECDALVVGNDVVSERVFRLFPDRAEAWRRKHSIVSVGVDTGLFEPVLRKDRRAAVERLLAVGLEEGGRTRSMTAGLLGCGLSSDKTLMDAAGRSRALYSHRLPDEDLPDRLRAVDWGGKIIIFVGKLIAAKGLQDIAAALPAVLEKHPDTTLLVAGEGPFREGLELLLHALSEGDVSLFDRLVRLGWGVEGGAEQPLASIEVLCARRGLDRLLEAGKRTRPADRVVFTGYLRHPLLRHLLPCADLAVFPSEIAEAYPLVLLESISAGVLPLGCDFEGLGEGLKTIGAGLKADVAPFLGFDMSPGERIASMERNLIELLSRDPEDWREDCRALAERDFSWPAVAGRMEKAYEAAI